MYTCAQVPLEAHEALDYVEMRLQAVVSLPPCTLVQEAQLRPLHCVLIAVKDISPVPEM